MSSLSNYPTSLDSTTNLPDDITDQTFQNDPDHATITNTVNDATIAIETKLGTGASTPIASTVLRGTGTGTTSYEQVNLISDVTGVLPISNGGTGSSTLDFVQLGGDIGGTDTDPEVISTHLSSPLPIAQGGTGSTTQDFVSLAGDLGNTVTSPEVLSTHLTAPLPIAQGGTGSATQNFVDLTTAQTIDGVKTFGSTIVGSINGNAATVTTNADLTGPITSVGNATSIASQTGTGSVFVVQDSPTLTTPNIGTPSAGVATNITGLPLTTGVTGILPPANGGTGVANGASNTITFTGDYPIDLTLSASTSLTLPTSGTVTALGNTVTGTGSIVLDDSPTLVTPALGTPASGVATNLTGLPLTTGVTGVLPVANGGTDVSTASITAFNNITGYSASGATGTTTTNLVFSTSPTLITPALGTPSAIVLTNGTGLPLTTGVTGNLPVTNLDSGTSASSTTFWCGDGSWATPSGAGNVTGPSSAISGDLAAYSGTTGTIIDDPVVATIGGNPVWQFLGYVQITATQSTTSTSAVEIPGLTVGVTIPSGVHQVKVTVFARDAYLSTASAVSGVYIYSGASAGALTTLLATTQINNPYGYSMPVNCISVSTPTSGSLYFTAAFSTGNSADALNVEAGTGYPAFILVEAC